VNARSRLYASAIAFVACAGAAVVSVRRPALGVNPNVTAPFRAGKIDTLDLDGGGFGLRCTAVGCERRAVVTVTDRCLDDEFAILVEADANLESVGEADPIQRLLNFRQHAHRGSILRLVGPANPLHNTAEASTGIAEKVHLRLHAGLD